MVDVDGIVEKLETNEKIIKICSESLKLPHLIEHLNQISSTLTNNGSGACSSSSSSNSLNAHAPPPSSQLLLSAVNANANANATPTTNSSQPMSSSSSSSSSSSCSLPNNQFNQPESNILRLFAKQLLTLKVCNKQTHSNIFNRYPSIKLWLKLLNISMSSIDAISSKKLNFHDLYERKDEHELNGYLRKNDVKLNDNELDILFKAFQILKIYYSNVEKDPSTNKNTSQTTTGANSSYQYIANASRQQLDQLTDNNNNNNNNHQSSSPNGSALVANKNITNHIIPTTSTSASISSSSSSSSSSVLTNEHTPAVSIGIQPATTITNSNNVRQNIELNPNYLSSRSKQQRKSESDVQVDGVMNSKSNMLKNHLHHHHPNNGNYAAGNHHHLTSYYNINTNTNSPHLNKSHLSSTLNNINNSAATSANKNLTFSPNLAIKPSKKNNAQKVTTPPPSRKLSTGNPSAIVTTAQIKAIAAYAAKTIKDYEPTTTGKANSKTNLDGGVNVAGGDAFNDETAEGSNNSNSGSMNNMHRSSSHESHLRNKVYSQSSSSQLSPNAINDANFVGSYDQQHITTTGAGSNDHHNSYNSLNSNTNPQLKHHQHQQSSTENMRRLSDGSELSSMCPSGQASPNLQSPTHAYKQTYGSNLTSGDDLNKLNQKSPKQTRDHSWTNTWNIKNCGICNKKMFMGLKCKYCKFRCHKECEKKSPQKCRVGLVLLTDGDGRMAMSSNSASSSASSSTAPSPAIPGAYHNGNGNGGNTSGSLNPQQSNPFALAMANSTLFYPTNIFNNNNNANNNNMNESNTTNTASATSHHMPNIMMLMSPPATPTFTVPAAPNTASWTSGVVRYANKIVNSFNNNNNNNNTSGGGGSSSGSGVNAAGPNTPTTYVAVNNIMPGVNACNSKYFNTLFNRSNLFNHDAQFNGSLLESKSSSSCNSSEPNSPNAFSPFQTFLQSFPSPNNHTMNTDNNNNSLGYHLNNNNSHITNNTINANKKSSSSSISSASIGYYQQPNSISQSQSLVIGTTVNDTPGDDESGRKQRDHSGVEFDLNNASTTNKTFDPAIDSIQTSVNSLKASMLDKTLTDMTNATTTTTTTTSSSTTTTTSNTAVTDMNDFPAESDTSQMNSSSSNDVQQFNIIYDEITDKEELGRGRFGVVYKAHWHGFVAVKEIDFNVELGSGDESIELKNFREEVLNLKKTRHTNLILFIGACMKPPKCAIVMSLCRGVSLYKYLRSDTYNRPNFDWIIDIATQIAQGMGYLHNKQLIHKDLRSKNIFIDGGKALITDFGLYSFTKLCTKLKCYNHRISLKILPIVVENMQISKIYSSELSLVGQVLFSSSKVNKKHNKYENYRLFRQQNKRDDLIPITKECLFYMAPELVRLIGTNRIDKEFSQASDVYSFGTIWYELFCYEYPFLNHSTDTVLYLIGHGLKNYSPNIQIPKEFKFILMKCWSKEPSNRLDFSRLLETFRAIPKKSKLFRSPSHPVHIGRSLEALHTATLNDTNKN